MNLSSLAIGSLKLSPAFDKDITAYTVATTNATNTVNAKAENSAASVLIKNGDTEIENGTAVTWNSGENILTVTVTFGGKSKVYTVTVTKE